MTEALGQETILDRLDRIEASMADIGAALEVRDETDSALKVLADDLLGYRKQILAEAHLAEGESCEQRILDRLSRDVALRFPHRKIVETLLGQYDPSTGEFGALVFSRLVRDARASKSRAKSYLSELQYRRVHRTLA